MTTRDARQGRAGLRRQVLLGTTLATSAFLGGYRGYVRRAFADCTGAGGTYVCSGATVTRQDLASTTTPITVTTTPGFSINTPGDAAFSLSSVGGLSFTDLNFSPITGDLGIDAVMNTSVGNMTITTTGTVTGTAGQGIHAVMLNATSGDLTINAAAVSGTQEAIWAIHNGTGDLAITTTGAVKGGTSGADYDGIYAAKHGGHGAITINVTDVTGFDGIIANGISGGDVTITSTGTVTGTGATTGTGISTAITSTGNLTVTTVNVTGVAGGIFAGNFGSGDVSITSTGTVTATGATAYGIGGYTAASAGKLTINAADVKSTLYGIYARHLGTGDLLITTTGTVTATGKGIFAYAGPNAQSQTISVASVEGADDGIHAVHAGSGPLSITTTGTVVGAGGNGIYAANTGAGGLSISAGTVTGVTGIAVVTTGAATVTSSGIVTGTGGTAIDVTGATGSTAVNITGGAINGAIAGSGNAILNFNLGAGRDFSLAGTVNGMAAINVNSGTAKLDGTATAGITIVKDTLIVGSDAAHSGALLNGPVNVYPGGTLGGTGIVGATAINDGGILTGVQGQTLTTGNLVLASGSNVNVALGAPGNATSLFRVNGNLTLAGTLNVSDAGGFGQGLYRVIDYAGTLTDNGMAIGVMPSGTAGTVQTAVAHQVNLVVSGAVVDDNWFWNGTTTSPDGTIHGGSGTWSAGPGTNWVNASGGTAAAWDGRFAVFQANPGTVTVDGSAGAVAATGMQFVGAGWVVTGDAITLTGTGGAATVRVGDGTAAGASSTATINAVLAGGSRLVKDDLGTLILTADNTFGGGTTIAAGTLQLGDGGATGAIKGDVTDNGVLAFNRSNDVSFAGAIGGNGVIRQIGAGKTELTGNSAGFTGATTVESGILAVNGQLGGALNVLAGGRLQGTGTVGNTIVGGTIAPGNSIGTLSVGNIVFNPGSIYEVEVNASGQSDKIAASGSATINGGTVKVLASNGNYAPATTYTILTATGGASGGFSGVTSNLAFLDPALSYDPNNVYLTLTRNSVSFSAIGATPNQVAVGGGLDSLGGGNPVYDAALQLSLPQAQNAFDQLSGEVHASAQSALIDDSRFIRNAAIDRIRTAFDTVGATRATLPTKAPPQVTTAGPVLWGQGFGSWGHVDGDGNAARLSHETGGIITGGDIAVADTWRIGLMGGYSRSNFDVKDRASSGVSDNYHVGIYGGTQAGPLGLRLGATYTWHDIVTNRSVVFPGIADHPRGDYQAGTTQVFGELGYGIRAGGFGFEPFVNAAYVNLHTEGFLEQGGAAALRGNGGDTGVTFTTLGLHLSNDFMLGSVAATVRGTLGWRHAFGDTLPLATLALGGGAPFTVAGVPIAQDAAVVDAGLDFAIARNATIGVAYSGQFGNRATDQSVKGNLSIRF